MQFTLLETSASPGRDPATTWIAIAVGVLTIVYVVFVRPLRKKKEKDPLQRGPSQVGLSRQRAVEREMSNLLVELSEMARQMTAQLDTRSAKLELLLKEADEKIALLKSARAGAAATGMGAPGPDRAESTGTASASEGVIMEARAAFRPVLPEPAMDPRHAQVYDLADEGHSPQDIARQLDRPSGEIELILALRGDSSR